MAIFRTIHTIHGLQSMAQAEAAGVPINLTHMAVGDGLGNDVLPSEAQTQLARELFRAPVNRVFQDPTNPTRFTAELVIPASAGGFTMREVGIFDASGGLFAVGNLPATYKPIISEGAYADTVVRLEFMVSNAGVVALQVDPNVAVATQTWISNNVTAATMIPGGTTNQILAKESNADGDTKWMDPSAVNVVVDMVEETQTLAADQLVVILATVTTRGLAVYVNEPDSTDAAQRLRQDQWAADLVDATMLTLAQSYADGTKLILAQNEPAGSAPQPLEQSKNLGDILSKPAARANLGVYSQAETDEKTPVSAVMHFPRTAAPGGWMKANGAAISRTAYAALFAVIGTTFGAGDGFNTFNLPDLRGEFLRGWDDGRGLDNARGMGTVQAGAFGSHGHTASSDTQGSHTHGGNTDTQGNHQHDSGWGESGNSAPYGAARYNATGSGDTDGDNQSYLTSTAGGHAHNIYTDEQGSHSHNISVNASGGTETRPRNIALLACIKY